MAELPQAGVDDADEAVARAREAFPAWRRVSPAERAELMRAVSSRIREHADDLARLEARNVGKPISDARGEVGMVADVFDYYAGAPERLLGDTIPVAGGLDFTFREPLGVVGLITPWNFPLAIASWKVGPALAAGNTIVLKPAELTPLTAVELERIAVEAGIPEGVFNVVVGPGRVVGERIVEHPDVAKVAFTGIDRGGPPDRGARGGDDQARDARAGRQVGQRRVRRRRSREGRGGGARWRCSATPGRTAARARASSSSASALDRFMAALEEAVEAINVGDPLDDSTEMGPLISEDQRETVVLIRRRRRAGGDPRQRAGGQGLLVPADGAVPGRRTTTARRARRSSGRSRASSRSATRPRRSGSRTTRSTACRARSGPATARRRCASRARSTPA